jgi:phytanoyl-CoA hydroxylase
MPASTVQYRVDDRQIQHFDEEGYLIVEHLFTDQELQPVIDEISADLDQRCRDAVAAGTLSRTYEEYDFEHRLTHVNAENADISKSMWDMKLVLPSFFGLMTNPKLLDVTEQFCGPEIIASSVTGCGRRCRATPGARCRGIRTQVTLSLTATWASS